MTTPHLDALLTKSREQRTANETLIVQHYNALRYVSAMAEQAAQEAEVCAAELAMQEKRIAELEKKYSEEADEFNAGYDAAKRGEPMSSEPSNTPYDVWCIGWVWGDFQRKAAALTAGGE